MDTDLQAATLGMSDRNPIADLLTEAFFENPAHVYIHPERETRWERLRGLMYENAGNQLTIGRSFALKSPDGAIAAMAFWHAPGAVESDLSKSATDERLAAIQHEGWFQRMLETVQTIEARRLSSLGGRESWYLNNMVVNRDRRGRGLGGRLLSQQLTEVVAPSGLPASLSTQRQENVSFYGQLGFKVADDDMIGQGGHRFRNWIMIYDPHSEKSSR
jgi:GNAT superfamily N-acetyltransferase